MSVMVTEPARVPPALGLKVTLIVQLAPGAIVVPQVLVSAKSPPFVPVVTMLETPSATVPVLLSVIVCAPLVVPTS